VADWRVALTGRCKLEIAPQGYGYLRVWFDVTDPKGETRRRVGIVDEPTLRVVGFELGRLPHEFWDSLPDAIAEWLSDRHASVSELPRRLAVGAAVWYLPH
jgi:hypothetical protein